MSYRQIVPFVCASLLSLGSSAFAQSETGRSSILPEVIKSRSESQFKPTIGLSSGYADTQGHRGGTTYGIEAAYQPVIPFGLGVALGGYVSDHSETEATLTRTKLLAKGTYNFGGRMEIIKNSYVGVGVGAVLDNVSGRNDVNLGIEPTIGFDIPLAGDLQRWSLGASANYLFVGGAKADVFAMNGIAKYLF